MPKKNPPSEARLKLAATIRRLRRQQKWSQEKLAELCGLHPNYIGGIERGERNVSIDNIDKISRAFELRVKDLFD